MSEYKKRGFLLENFRLFHLKSAQGTQVDYHYHEFCKVLLLIRGRGSYFIDGQRYLLQSGDIVLIGNRSIHRPELDSDAPYERIILYISPEYLRSQSTVECDLLSVFSGERGHVLRPGDGRKQKIFRMAAALEQDLEGSAFGREILSNTGMLRLLVEIGRNKALSESEGPGPTVPKSGRIPEILRYIDDHLSEELDAEHLAKVFYVSKYHMMRQFRLETGTTIHSYITQKRLIRAKELMDGGMRATEACYHCGFHSYSAFTRACGKYFGTTPTGRTGSGRVREADYE